MPRRMPRRRCARCNGMATQLMEWWPKGPGKGRRVWICLLCFQEVRQMAPWEQLRLFA